jgi:hypothetical protein
MKFHQPQFHSMEFHGIPWNFPSTSDGFSFVSCIHVSMYQLIITLSKPNFMKFHEFTKFSMEFHEIPSTSVPFHGHHGIPWNSMEFSVNIWRIFSWKFSPWNFMKYFMGFHEIPWNSPWHGIPWKISWIHGTIYARVGFRCGLPTYLLPFWHDAKSKQTLTSLIGLWVFWNVGLWLCLTLFQKRLNVFLFNS